jgi:flavin reductase (DIM6/NTAB) family NADH-FMN oxidoreductase RutF
MTPITSDAFKEALRHFPAGVTIVTMKTADGVQPHGLTVSAFASVSPKPPMILVCIDHKAHGHDLLEKAGTVFAVNILAEADAELSNRFAWGDEATRFEMGEWDTAVTGAPILKNALAWLDCTIYSRHHAGTHTIYIGEVQASGVPNADQKPLIYWNRDYQALE